MLRLFTLITVICFTYLATNFINGWDGNDKPVNVTSNPPPISDPVNDDNSSLKPPLVVDDGFAIPSPDSPKGAKISPQDLARKQQEEDIDRELRELTDAGIDHQDDFSLPPVAYEPLTAETNLPKYSKEEGWAYTTKAENDLAELDKLLSN